MVTEIGTTKASEENVRMPQPSSWTFNDKAGAREKTEFSLFVMYTENTTNKGTEQEHRHKPVLIDCTPLTRFPASNDFEHLH